MSTFSYTISRDTKAAEALNDTARYIVPIVITSVSGDTSASRMGLELQQIYKWLELVLPRLKKLNASYKLNSPPPLMYGAAGYFINNTDEEPCNYLDTTSAPLQKIP